MTIRPARSWAAGAAALGTLVSSLSLAQLATADGAAAARNLPPRQSAADALTMTPGGACSATPADVNRPPRLTATATDPNGDALGVQFAVSWNDGTGAARRWYSTGAEATVPTAFRPSGSSFSTDVPELPAPAAGSYGWTVRAWDGRAWGPWSARGAATPCRYRLDTTAPQAPQVSSATHVVSADPAASLPWADGVGRYASLTLHSPASDAVRYEYTLPGAAPVRVSATAPGAPVTVRVRAERSGPQSVEVQAFDAAGNGSPRVTYRFHVLDGEGPRALWSLDGPEATAEGGSFPAVLEGGAALGGPGHRGGALSLDGTGRASTARAVLDTTRSFSVSAWLRSDGGAGAGARTAVSQSGHQGQAFALGTEEQGGVRHWTLRATTADGRTVRLSSPAAAEDGRWTRVAGVYDRPSGVLRLYVDGAQAGSVLLGTGPADEVRAANGALDLGQARTAGGWGEPWTGAVDEVRLWDRPLTTAEATGPATDGLPAGGLGAKAVWELDEPAGRSEVTGTAQASALTLHGGAALTATGIAGQALALDGVDDLARTDRQQLDGERDFSVSAWVRLSRPTAGDTADRTVLAQTGGTTSQFALYWSGADQRWVFGRRTLDAATATELRAAQGAPGTGAVGEWTQLTAVSDRTAGRLRLYVNGEPAGEADQSAAPAWATAGALQLGAGLRAGTATDFLAGDLDAVRLWDRVVTSTEARELAVRKPQVTGRWRLDGTTGTTTPGEGPAGTALTLTGGAAVEPGAGLRMDGALLLDGTGAASSGPGTPIRTDRSFTVSAWAQPADLSRDATVLSLPGTTGSALTLRWRAAADGHPSRWEAEVRSTDTAGGQVSTAALASSGGAWDGWSNLTVAYDAAAGQLHLYVDGSAEAATAAVPAAPFRAEGGLEVGRTLTDGAHAEWFTGAIDDVWAVQGLLTEQQRIRLADFNSAPGTGEL
ncbi:LamG-like jellyroll fold domain-containing protein [Kitasatospora sp. NPDC096147]|uniref:LamG domain-containing protein n=1 Tax=Kitasatospora sp. NPDC096147 TaxID=3364093 RepID=UPI00380C40B2